MSESVDSLKQRLVGAFVILSLAVIFLPMLFDKPHHEGSSAVELIPPKPKMETVIISKPKPFKVTMPETVDLMKDDSESLAPKLVAASAGLQSAVTKPKSQVNPQAKATKSVAPVAVKKVVPVKSAGTAKSSTAKIAVKAKSEKRPSTGSDRAKVYSNVWMVQLGTFSKTENAYALRDKLRSAGIKGHTKPLESGSAVRVFAGPFVTKKEALRIKRKVDSKFKVKSLVVYFEA